MTARNPTWFESRRLPFSDGPIQLVSVLDPLRGIWLHLQAAQAVAASGLLTTKDPVPEAIGKMVLQFATSRPSSSSGRQPQVMALMDDIQVGD